MADHRPDSTAQPVPRAGSRFIELLELRRTTLFDIDSEQRLLVGNDDSRAVLEAASPLPIIGRVRAPLFVIHGANDPRVPLSEAEQVVSAVRSSGVECQLLVYQEEAVAWPSGRTSSMPIRRRWLSGPGTWARHLGARGS